MSQSYLVCYAGSHSGDFGVSNITLWPLILGTIRRPKARVRSVFQVHVWKIDYFQLSSKKKKNPSDHKRNTCSTSMF